MPDEGKGEEERTRKGALGDASGAEYEYEEVGVGAGCS